MGERRLHVVGGVAVNGMDEWEPPPEPGSVDEVDLLLGEHRHRGYHPSGGGWGGAGGGGGYRGGGGGQDGGLLTELVLVDGHVVDVRTGPVRGTRYEVDAAELDQLGLRRPRVVERPYTVREVPHEAMLDWLTRVVGGTDALRDLDATPLPAEEDLDLEAVPDWLVGRVGAIDEHVQAAGGHQVVGPELLTACRRLLVAAAGRGALGMWRESAPDSIAASVVHCVAKANGLIGAGAAMPVRALLVGLSNGHPSDRSRRIATAIGGAGWPHGRRPQEAPDVYVLGDVGMLLSCFRRDLLVYRAHAEALRAEEVTPQPVAVE